MNKKEFYKKNLKKIIEDYYYHPDNFTGEAHVLYIDFKDREQINENEWLNAEYEGFEPDMSGFIPNVKNNKGGVL